MILSAVFVLAATLQTTFSFSTKVSRYFGSTKISTHVLSTSRKQTTRFLVNSFGEFCGSTVSTAACYDQAIVFLFRGLLNHNRSPRALNSGKGACCHLSPLPFPVNVNRIDSHNRVKEGGAVGSYRINRLLFAEDLGLPGPDLDMWRPQGNLSVEALSASRKYYLRSKKYYYQLAVNM